MRRTIRSLPLLLLLLLLCGCGQGGADLPDGVGLRQQADGTAILLYEGDPVGGVRTLDYVRTGATTGTTLTSDALSGIWDQLLEPDEGRPDYILSNGTQGQLVLAFATDRRSEEHNLFPVGDQFRDIWYAERAFPPEIEEALLTALAPDSEDVS